VAAQRDKLQIDELEALDTPIEFLTENGFTILRSWEIGETPLPANGSYSFVVRKEQSERQVIVTVGEDIIADIRLRTRGRIDWSHSFWISSAEHHLANYLWEQDDFPTFNQLIVDQLDPEEIMSALNWKS
jgi:hypothetical protein